MGSNPGSSSSSDSPVTAAAAAAAAAAASTSTWNAHHQLPWLSSSELPVAFQHQHQHQQGGIQQQHFHANAASYGASYMPSYAGSSAPAEFGLPFSSAGYPHPSVAIAGSYPSGHYFFGNGDNCGFYNSNSGQSYQQISPSVVERSVSTSSSPEFKSQSSGQQIQVKPDLLSESYSDHSSPRQDWSPLTPPTGV